MNSTARWPYYAAALVVFLAAKLRYAQATTTDVHFLLAPTNALVSVMLNSDFWFEPLRGYVHADLRIVIDKSCAGGNFWLLSWLLLSWTYLQRSGRRPGVVMLGLAAVSLGFTWLVNAARIVGAVELNQLLPVGVPPPAWLHEAQGALVYLFFLVACHFGMLFLLSSTRPARAHSA